MSFQYVVKSGRWMALVMMTLSATALFAQEPPSKVDVFTGYSWVHPGTGFPVTIIGGQENLRRGFTIAPTYFFSRHWGATFDADWHACRCEPKIWSFMGGPTYRFPGEHVTPFLHAFAGLHRMKLGTFGWDNGIGVLAGGGLDVKAFRHLAIRVIQADYEFARHNFDPSLGTTNMHGVRLAAGLVWRFGSIGPPPVPPTAACSVQPSEVLAGEPVSVTASGTGFNPGRTAHYAWSGTGVKVSGTGSTTQVETTGLEPGSYRVEAKITDGSKNGIASCAAGFSVRAPRGPTVSCSSDPGTVVSGGNSIIRSNASSPDNRALLYTYSVSAGTVTGTGPSATLNTQGVPPGSITVNCNVADDHTPALTATSPTTVMVEALPLAPPAPPPALEATQLNEIDFKQNSARVDNAAKAILDDVALRLQRDSEARAVLVGQSDASERGGTQLAAQRASHAKDYLVKEKGIDASRLETRTGSTAGQHVQVWLVPAGATFNADGTQSADQAGRRRR